MHVLLIEDDPTTRHVLAAQLRACDLRVTAVDSSESAAVVIGAWGSPDVVVADIDLPGVSGAEYASHLREWFGPERLGLVLISGTATPSVADRAEMFLPKPCLTRDLLAAVKSVQPAA
jgi:CheY-like chemotaxis protein